MKKSVVLLLAVALLSLVLTACGNHSSNNNKSLNVTDVNKSNKAQSNKEKAAAKAKKDASQPAKPKSDKIIDNIDQIESTVMKLNNFSNGNGAYFDKIKAQLEKEHVTPDEVMRQIYVTNSTSSQSSTVLVGKVMSHSKQVNGNTVQFNFQTRTAKGPITGSDTADEAGEDYYDRIDEDAYKSYEVTTSYQLNISEDGKTATLNLLTPDWADRTNSSNNNN